MLRSARRPARCFSNTYFTALLKVNFGLEFVVLRRWRSGQSQQTVNLSPIGLRRFESFPTHQMKKDLERKGLRTWIEIDTKALEHNYLTLKKNLSKNCKIMSVVKSNAYGHGFVGVAKEMEKSGVDWIGVDSIMEALALREEGVTKPILVLGYTLPEMLPRAADLDISITVSTFELLGVIASINFSKKLKIHIKVDTGMHRQGFQEFQIQEVIDMLKVLENKVLVEGLFTHFAAAKDPSVPEKTLAQVVSFGVWVSAFDQAGFKTIKHTSASGGTLIFPQAHFDMVRIGIALYGIWPSKETKMFSSQKVELKPILSWRTIIGEVKKVPKGDSVGYDFTETFSRDSTIAICPIGYWHGYARALSSVGCVLVRGARARVLGRVSMDMIIIDTTDIPDVSVGDEVTLIGTDGGEIIRAEELADLAHNSPYEFVTRLNPLIKRIYL